MSDLVAKILLTVLAVLLPPVAAIIKVYFICLYISLKKTLFNGFRLAARHTSGLIYY